MKKQILLLLMLCLTAITGFAQVSDADLQNRYFNARNRLKKWFITVGGGEGQSLPIENIRMGWPPDYRFMNKVMLKSNGNDSFLSQTEWDANGLYNDKMIKNNGYLNGDNPLITLGEYICILSTEYWLLKYYNKEGTDDFNSCVNELYYALAAIDRLDKTSENYFNKNITPSPSDYNGFLRRDDMADGNDDRVNNYFGYMNQKWNGELQAAGFHTRGSITPDKIIEYADSFFIKIRKQLKDTFYIDTIIINGNPIYDTTRSPRFRDSIVTKAAGKRFKYYKHGYRLEDNVIWRPDRDDGVWDKGPGRLSNEPSIDEIIGIMMGVKFLQKFVDEDCKAKPLPTDSIKYLVQWSREIIDRIMLWMSKETTDIRALDGEAYSEQQKFACAKDQCGLKKKDAKTKDDKFDSKKCPECAQPDLYTKYTNKLGEGSVFNPVIFKKGNYVLTNPAANNRLVNRGPMAFAFGYPLEKLGEELTSKPGSIKDYPSVSMTLDDEEIITKYFGDLYIDLAKGNINVLMALFSGFDEIRGNKAFWDHIYFELEARCVGLTTFGPDGTCLCLTGYPFTPKMPGLWKSTWEKLGDTTAILNKVWTKYAINGGSANIMAAKLAACTGTWGQGDFADFSAKCGFPMLSLVNDMLNDKSPALSQTYFNGLLSKIDCQGSQGTSYPMERDMLSGAQMVPNLSTTSNVGQNNFKPRFDYMLYYNLYKIAQIKYWGGGVSNFNDNSCPCFFDSIEHSTKLMVSAIEPAYWEKTLIDPVTLKDYNVYGYEYNSIQVQSKPLVKTKDANPSHTKIGVRQHEYLNHHYELGTNQTFEVIRDLVVCNSDLLIKSGGKVLLDTPANQLSPNEIVVRNNGQIRINNNGQLYVQNGSRVVIEQGAFLNYNQGARIILNGPSAVLHIKGGLVLGQNATFQIEGGPAGKGYVIWENNWIENPPNYNNSVSINPGSVLGSNYGASAGIVANSSNTILFTNPSGPFNGAGNLALKCLGNLGLMTTWGLGKLEIKECKVELGPESRIVSEAGNTAITNVDVNGYMGPSSNTKYDWKYTSMGVHILGRKNDLSHVKFTNCYLGLKIFNVGTHEPLNLTDVNFHNCIKAIQNDAGRIIYNGGEINGQAGLQRYAGIEGIGTQGRSDLNYVNVVVPNYQWLLPSNKRFAKGEYCAGLKSHGTAEYYLLKSSISQADKGIELDQSFARPVCSILDNNGVAVSAIQNSKFNITNNTHNTISYDNNSPSSPRYFLRGYQNVYLYLDAAANAITGSNYNNNFVDITVSKMQNLAGSNGITSFHPLNTPGIAASGNQWNIWNGNQSDIWNTSYPYPTPTNENVSIIGTYLGNVSGLDLLTRPTINQTTFDAGKATNCPIYEANKGWKLLGPPPSNWANEPVDPFLGVNIVQRSVGFIPYRRSLFSAGGNMNWLGFLNECKTILDTIIPDTLGMAMHDIYTGVHSSYKDLFIDTTIPPMNKSTIELAAYNLLTSMQQNLITRSNDMDNAYRFMRFELHRDLALIHRSFNHRNDGISHINSVINTFTNPKDQEALLAWKCILEREQMYLDTLIAYDSVFLYSCVPNYYNDDTTHNFVHFGFEPWLYNGGGEENYNYAPNPSGLTTPPATKKQPTNSNLTLFPNPAENSYTIVCNEAMFNIRVTDNTGRVIQTLNANGQKSLPIDASNYSRGIYFVEAYSTDKRFVQRLLINK